MMPDKKVTAIVLNWNGMKYIDECLGSLQGQNHHPLTVIFVDNGSSDGSQYHVRKHFPWVETIVLDKNQGFDVPNNLAMKRALSEGADYLLLVNNDVVLEPNAISELVEAGERDPSIGALGSVQLKYSDPTQVISAGGSFDWKRGIVVQCENRPVVNREVRFLSGAVFMLKKTVAERVGMLDEDYYFYGEDVDLSTRIMKHQYKLVCVASSIVRHHVRGSTAKSPFHVYHITRARWILMRKHASLFDWLYFIPFYVKNSILGECRWYLRHGYKDEARAMIWAIMDSFRNRLRSTYSGPVDLNSSPVPPVGEEGG